MIAFQPAGATSNREAGGATDRNGPSKVVDGSVVVIDDDTMTLRVLQKLLHNCGYSASTYAKAASGLESIDDTTAVALVDLRMPDVQGLDCLKYIRQHYPQVQVIIITGSTETEDAVEAMREGAFQYVTKPFNPKQLEVYVAKAFDAWRTAHQNRDLLESHSHNIPVQVPAAAGDVNDRLMNQIERLAGLESTVFIGGESGTGKSTVARLIHQQSQRADGPFVSINCASLPRDLLTSELFGHTKGSFTGAVKDRPGHAEVAHQGTLFLDEIGDLPLELQPKLITFLQDRTVQRLGSSEVRKVDVRLIVATHRDLTEMCRLQSFRQDLYFRLMVLSIDLPPLRHRQAELPSMANDMLARVCDRMRIAPKRLSPHAINAITQHSWPGNIRELENVLERAAAFSATAEIGPEELELNDIMASRTQGAIGGTRSKTERCASARPTRQQPALPTGTSQDDVQTSLSAHHEPGSIGPAHQSGDEAGPAALAGMSLVEIERAAIVQTLEKCEGNKAKSARMLGISEKSIYNKMRRLDIQWK